MIAFVTLIFSVSDISAERKNNLRNLALGLGFDTHVDSDQGKRLSLPEMVFCGKFEGETAAKIRDDVNQQVSYAMDVTAAKIRYMVLVSNGYAWALKTI
ncbi:hypothetical protein HU719_006050 [Pseudomonas sp. SWRI107]|uniref:hypothetical protein n=1 Tax=Pseudomonas farsensis TaxID=2745492 RepID=UPI0016441323|nr:hypothetical protein [Pseudomonas farsensis]MBV4530966.1 hypothetical protein [Pseudomonas farsensis]